ncbi:MAG TPA: holo-ACP synthase [Armatimonadota bacterium]|nr:holo-ACP synthase [Armatimonadota bacterium]
MAARVIGIGIDFCELDRIESLMDRLGDRFLKRIFSAAEIEYVGSGSRAAIRSAGLFAAKEAVVKCLGTGFSCGVGWKCVEAVPLARGGWGVALHNEAARRAAAHGATRWLMDIQFDRRHAAAVAVWITSEG